MKKAKKIFSLCIALVVVISILAGCGGIASNSGTTSAAGASSESNAASTAGTQQVSNDKKVEIEVIAVDPEYEAQDRQIWNLYTEQHPNVTFKISSVNEDQAAALTARIAAGNAPDIQDKGTATKDNYKTYVNLLNINYPYWNKYSFDYKELQKTQLGITEDYVPVLQPFTGRYFQFAYYKDEIAKAGLDPRNTVRTIDDLDKFFADLKAYLTKTNRCDYCWEVGWGIDFVNWIPAAFAEALGFTQQQMADTYLGKIKWTDPNGPYAAGFKKMKEYYDKGYFPKNWWTNPYDKVSEASFIAKKSVLIFQGPWIYAKTEAADPNVQLSAFPMPANKDGKIFAGPMDLTVGVVMFAQDQKKPYFDEIVKAFNWYNSPEIAKMRCEAMNFFPIWDLSDVGGLNVKNTQYTEFVKPLNDGVFGNIQVDRYMWPWIAASKYAVAGKPDPVQDDAMAATYGKYFSGEMQLNDLLSILQKRWEDAYKVN